MKRIVLTLIAPLALTLALAGTALAEIAAPGTIGEPNCQGQTTAFMAQKFAAIGEPGLVNTASEFGRSVLEEQVWIVNRCNP